MRFCLGPRHEAQRFLRGTASPREEACEELCWDPGDLYEGTESGANTEAHRRAAQRKKVAAAQRAEERAARKQVPVYAATTVAGLRDALAGMLERGEVGPLDPIAIWGDEDGCSADHVRLAFALNGELVLSGGASPEDGP